MNTPPDTDVADIEARLTATLQRKAAGLVVTDRPFGARLGQRDNVHRSLVAGELADELDDEAVDDTSATVVTLRSAAVARSERRRRGWILATSSIAVAAGVVAALVIVNRGRDREDQAPPAVGTSPGSSDTATPTPSVAATAVPAASPTVASLPDPPQVLPTWLPDGYQIWHLTRRPESSTVADYSWQQWRNATLGVDALLSISPYHAELDDSGQPVETRLSSGEGTEMAGAFRIRQEDDVQGKVYFSADYATPTGGAILEGGWPSTKVELRTFLAALTPVDLLDLNQGFAASSPTWSLADGYVGTGSTAPQGVVEEIGIATSLPYESGDAPTNGLWLDVSTNRSPRVEGWESRTLADGSPAQVSVGAAQWFRDGLQYSLDAPGVSADDVLRIAESIVAVSDEEWRAATTAVADRLAGDQVVRGATGGAGPDGALYGDGTLCVIWRDGYRQCAARGGMRGFAAVFERDGEYHAVGTWETTEVLSGAEGVMADDPSAPPMLVDQVQIDRQRLYHVRLTGEGGYAAQIQVGGAEPISFSVNADG